MAYLWGVLWAREGHKSSWKEKMESGSYKNRKPSATKHTPNWCRQSEHFPHNSCLLPPYSHTFTCSFGPADHSGKEVETCSFHNWRETWVIKRSCPRSYRYKQNQDPISFVHLSACYPVPRISSLFLVVALRRFKVTSRRSVWSPTSSPAIWTRAHQNTAVWLGESCVRLEPCCPPIFEILFVSFCFGFCHLLLSQSMGGSKGSVIRTHMEIFYMLETRGSEWSRNRDMGQSGNGKTVKIVSGSSDKCPVLVFVLNKQTNKQIGSVTSRGIHSLTLIFWQEISEVKKLIKQR